MITLNCPSCHEELHIPEQYAGQAGACTKCGARILVPGAGAQAPQGTTAPGGAEGGSALPDDLAAALEASLSAAPRRPVVTTPSLGERLQPLIMPLGIGLGLIAIVAVVVAGVAYMPWPNLVDKPSPEEITRGFLEASKAGSMAQCQPYVTAKTWEIIQNEPVPQGNMNQLQGYTIGTASSRGTDAEVPVEVVNQMGMTVASSILLRQEAGNWRVYGMRLAPVPGMEMTLNFEDPEGTAAEMQKAMEKMTPEMLQEMMQQ